MNTPLGRNGLIGLAVGATAGGGLIAFIIYREIRRRKSHRMVLEARPAPRLFDAADGAALLRETHDAQGGFTLLCLALSPACHVCMCVCLTVRERHLVPTAKYPLIVVKVALFHGI